jgi:hypothetical protein
MKLTPELLAQSPSHINPVKERQLDLRGIYLFIYHYALVLCVHRLQNPCPRKLGCNTRSLTDLLILQPSHKLNAVYSGPTRCHRFYR